MKGFMLTVIVALAMFAGSASACNDPNCPHEPPPPPPPPPHVAI